MGRAPCCEKVGLKRGPWTSEEDYILISFIQQHGHSNWRALPKQSGLLRCGKSCRLRWINYLRPDLKRGNFSKQEEDTIIQLHKVIGNRWAAIASKLPGRTDNEIKNVWHTHLKKRVYKHNEAPKSLVAKHNNTDNSSPVSNFTNNSSQQSESSNDFSSFTDVSSEEIPNNTASNVMEAQIYDPNNSELLDELPIIDETYWSSPEISYDEFSMDFTFPDTIEDVKLLEASSSSNYTSMYSENGSVHVHQDDSLDFWLNVLVKTSGAEDLFAPIL